MKITLILTTTINTQNHISWLKQRNSEERKQMYEEIIKLWLKNTNFKIVIVENSGSNFNLEKNKNLEIISFTYPEKDKIILDKLEAKGQHEMYSIQYACNNSKFIKDSDYVIKITGRYFIPKLENLINKLVNNHDCIRQSQIWRKMNRCEIVGCHKNIIDKIFYFPLKDDMMEQEMMNRMEKLKILELPKMKLHKPTKQGVGNLMKEL